jgi:hypothetical protein
MDTQEEMEAIKGRVIAGMKKYLLSFKEVFKGSIYTNAGTSVIPWKNLKFGDKMQQKYLIAYEPEVCRTLEQHMEVRKRVNPDTNNHYLRCLWTQFKSYHETTKWYNRYTELQIDIHIHSDEVCMIVSYGKVACNLYPYKTEYRLKENTDELTVKRSRIPSFGNSDPAMQCFDTNDPNGLGSLDTAILILGNIDLITTEISGDLRAKEARYQKYTAKREAENIAMANHYGHMLSSIGLG